MYSQVNDAQIFEYMVKYRLPSSILGSICWHQSQLQDLLTMVQEFGMVHYFKTLLKNEMIQLK
jgi:hypothetical protein